MAKTHKQDSAADTAVQATAGLSMQELYDALMSQIEPELTSGMMHLLDSLYTGETPEERQKRGERYVRAFETLDVVFDSLMGICHEEMNDYKEQVLSKFRKKEGKKDAAHLSDIDRAIDAA